jgi:metal-responsive CopG/Arc/MetJ family transcriptional regulator
MTASAISRAALLRTPTDMVACKLPLPMLATVDAIATRSKASRAETLRRLIHEALQARFTQGAAEVPHAG